MNYTAEQRAYFVKVFYQENSSYASFKARIKREKKMTDAKIPTANALKKWVNDFEEKGSVQNTQKRQPKRVRTEENIEKVRQHFEDHPHDSVRRNGLNMSKSTVHRILREDLGLHPYKLQTSQALSNLNHAAR